MMGRQTYESIGKPLAGRQNIVISRTKVYPDVRTYNDPELAYLTLQDEL